MTTKERDLIIELIKEFFANGWCITPEAIVCTLASRGESASLEAVCVVLWLVYIALCSK